MSLPSPRSFLPLSSLPHPPTSQHHTTSHHDAHRCHHDISTTFASTSICLITRDPALPAGITQSCTNHPFPHLTQASPEYPMYILNPLSRASISRYSHLPPDQPSFPCIQTTLPPPRRAALPTLHPHAQIGSPNHALPSRPQHSHTVAQLRSPLIHARITCIRARYPLCW